MSRAMGAHGDAPRAESRTGNSLPRFSSTYLKRSQLPLTSLVFLLPLVILYEAGTYYFSYDAAHHTETRIVAFTLLQRFFGLFGATGRFLPAMSVAVILLALHITHKDRWQIDLKTPVLMAMESLLLCMPLFVLNMLSVRFLPLWSISGSWPSTCVSPLGAGIYEELVFRLIGFTLLSILLADVLRVRRPWATLLIVVFTSVAFSAYHYLNSEPFQWRTFAFRTAAGIYFGIIFLSRGFGITAGCHAAYDLIAVFLTAYAAH